MDCKNGIRFANQYVFIRYLMDLASLRKKNKGISFGKKNSLLWRRISNEKMSDDNGRLFNIDDSNDKAKNMQH